ncbi:MAG: FAD-dependent oxidoreductase [Bacteroidetes bacterium]|nr:FAD-dependent oxidoreductase [Bacteroidota bacterium]
MNRASQIIDLKQIGGEPWDVIIIGGGATGLGIALDAATRGYKTLLLEKNDFASGTSSRSTKLVHGGVRYLAKGDLLLVIEALRERGLMLRHAPHITGNREFIVPVYSWHEAAKYYLGLKFYDFLAGRLSLGKSYFIGSRKVAERLPFIRTDKLNGGIVYHDGCFDDARMAVWLACEARACGAVVLNYFPVTGLLKVGSGHISGVRATDSMTRRDYLFNASVVINATGVFADTIHQFDNPLARPAIRPSQGVHIVLDSSFLGGTSALMIPKTDDGRVLFAIPWYGKVVAGTTDTPVDSVSEEPVALEDEIDFILATAGRYLARKPMRSDIKSIFAGLRPLVAGNGDNKKTKEISRRHKITVSASQLVSVTGGKWTTYRVMAEETLNAAIGAKLLPALNCVTKKMDSLCHVNAGAEGRLGMYGNGASEIEEMMKADEMLRIPIASGLPYTEAEVIWIVRNEMPCTAADVLSRRTRALIIDARASLKAAPLVAEIMARELGYDSGWQKREVEEYRKIASNYYHE